MPLRFRIPVPFTQLLWTVGSGEHSREGPPLAQLTVTLRQHGAPPAAPPPAGGPHTALMRSCGGGGGGDSDSQS
jgi:hypothetical protein